MNGLTEGGDKSTSELSPFAMVMDMIWRPE
jgi:hypothetical protein